MDNRLTVPTDHPTRADRKTSREIRGPSPSFISVGRRSRKRSPPRRLAGSPRESAPRGIQGDLAQPLLLLRLLEVLEFRDVSLALLKQLVENAEGELVQRDGYPNLGSK